jgi:hypothetical protein
MDFLAREDVAEAFFIKLLHVCVHVEQSIPNLFDEVSNGKMLCFENKLAVRNGEMIVVVKPRNLAAHVGAFGKIVESVEPKKALVGMVGVVVWIGEVRNHYSTLARRFEYAVYVLEQGLEVLDVFQNVRRGDFIYRVVGDKTKAFFQIGHIVHTL